MDTRRDNIFEEDQQPDLFGIGALSVQTRVAGSRPSYGRQADLRARVEQTGDRHLSDEDLLELLLCQAIPHGDARPLTEMLMRRFGDFNGVISARPARLAEVSGVGNPVIQALKVVEASAHRLAQAQIMNRNVVDSWQAVLRYCKVVMAHRGTEHFRVLFLNRKNILVADEEQARGTVDHVPVYPREVIKRALELNASALILVHNHPSGDPTPSNSDIEMTKRIDDVARALGITLHDHIIIGRQADISFRSAGLLNSPSAGSF